MLSHSSAIQRRCARITKDIIYFFTYPAMSKICNNKVCTGFCSMQCHCLRVRNWPGAQCIPAELWDRHVFPLQLSPFIVSKSRYSHNSLCAWEKNIGGPLWTNPLLRSCLWFSLLKWLRGFGHQFLPGFQLFKIQAIIYNIWWVTCGNTHL